MWKLCGKRVCDFLFALIVLILASPLLLVIALLVRLTSPGPILFRQARLGRHGNAFTILKFRTMVANAKEVVNPDGTKFVGAGDPRVTKVGGVLRRTSLDELPQFFNVLMGEMSVVGPRPETVDGPQLKEEYKPRLQVKPGITGWAVVNGRNRLNLDERRTLDAYYATHYNLWMDFSIVLKTIRLVFSGQGVTNP